MGSTCSVPDSANGSPTGEGKNVKGLVKSQNSQIATIERLLSRDRKLKKHSCTKSETHRKRQMMNNSNVNNNNNNDLHSTNHCDIGLVRRDRRGSHIQVQLDSIGGQLNSNPESFPKVYTFKEYKQYLQAKRENKVVTTPVTPLVKNNRCRTATLRKIPKDCKIQNNSSSPTEPSSSPASSSSPSSSTPSVSDPEKLTPSPTSGNGKHVTWEKSGRVKSSASDKDSDDSGVFDLTPMDSTLIRTKGRVRPIGGNNGRKVCNWSPQGNGPSKVR